MNKNIRKNKILGIIIKTHIDTAGPVGSAYISNIMGLSSATIRNVMAELDEDGYLVQPHTSAGRIPTERAYRVYVNSILEEREHRMQEVNKINNMLFLKYHKYRELIERTSFTLSKLTQYTSFVIYPKDHIYMDGTCCMLEHPEFCNLSKIKCLLRALDERERFLKIINSYLDTGILKIHIGRENTLDGFETCSIITASYRVRNKVVGGIGVIGPVRMKYRRVVPIVKYLADSVSRILERVA